LANCADGAFQVASLVADANGNLFGITKGGGANNAGTVFEIAKTAKGYASRPTILGNFCAMTNCADGAVPVASLVDDSNGNLFGITTLGGVGGNFNFGGTVFEIAKTAGSYASSPTTLVSFCGLANCSDGANPNSLTADANGNLFGTTVHGGAGVGTVFEIAKTANGYASTATILSSFEFGVTGASPSGLITDKNGNLFGVTGGFKGTMFEISKTASGYAGLSTLVRVCSLSPPSCADGSHPAAVIADAKDNLFGTTTNWGRVCLRHGVGGRQDRRRLRQHPHHPRGLPRREWRHATPHGPGSTGATAHTGRGSCQGIRRNTSAGSARLPQSVRTTRSCAEAR
jgi:hypothetical protein